MPTEKAVPPKRGRLRYNKALERTVCFYASAAMFVFYCASRIFGH
jgi:hypothetical protein